MRSQTNAMPLSVLLVPGGAGDYELIPLDLEALRQGGRLEVTLECLQRERRSSAVIGCSHDVVVIYNKAVVW